MQGGPSPDDRRFLAGLAETLGLSPADRNAVEAAAGAPPQGKVQASPSPSGV